MGSNRGGIEPSFEALAVLGGRGRSRASSRRDFEKRVGNRKRRRKKKEAPLEQRCVDRARELGWMSRKMNGLGYAAWPDRLFVRPARRLGKKRGLANVRPLWVEFKRPGQEPTKAQSDLHEQLRARGQLVEVVDNFEAFVELCSSAPD